MNKVVENWINIAEYDLETAEAMLVTGRYIYVAFMCQQTIEKYLKAKYVSSTGETPSYTHNLLRLAEISGIDKELNEEQSDFITELNVYYIKARYSEELEKIKAKLTKNKASKLFKNTQILAQWLKAKIK